MTKLMEIARDGQHWRYYCSVEKESDAFLCISSGRYWYNHDDDGKVFAELKGGMLKEMRDTIERLQRNVETLEKLEWKGLK
jgi:hypothetical protein